MTGLKEIAEVSIKRFAESPIGKMSEGKAFSKSISDYDKPLGIIYESLRNCPIENGTWDGERGNSKWIPNRDYVPPHDGRANYKNPDNLTWGEILDKHDIDGIYFKDGEPDFSKVSKGNVEIEGFNANRDDNFTKADIELAKQKGYAPEEVTKWRKDNNYTWHECSNMKTMQKVPNEVHANVPHSGGVSEAKKGNGE